MYIVLCFANETETQHSKQELNGIYSAFCLLCHSAADRSICRILGLCFAALPANGAGQHAEIDSTAKPLPVCLFGSLSVFIRLWKLSLYMFHKCNLKLSTAFQAFKCQLNDGGE